MKLRIRRNSLRFRLTQSEVASLRAAQPVRESVMFPGSGAEFSYSLETGEGLAQISARFRDGEVRVLIPTSWARSWAEGRQVGIEGEESLGDGNSLKVLVEKDFRCLEARPGEDETDNFPNPLMAKTACESGDPQR